MTDESGLISEHHSHADLQILLARGGREPHQVFMTDISDTHNTCELTCVCGKVIKDWPYGDALDAFEKHHRTGK